MLKEWEQQIKEREQQIEEKENNFDNDCAAYEMEATKWQRNQMSILASKEQLLNQELAAILNNLSEHDVDLYGQHGGEENEEEEEGEDDA